MSLSAIEYVRHILDETNYLLAQTENLTQDSFTQNETLKRAFVRSIEIIGEASKKIPTDIKDKYPNIEWRAIAGMRDRLIHDYFGIDYEIVWDIISNKIPELKKEIQIIIQNEGNCL